MAAGACCPAPASTRRLRHPVAGTHAATVWHLVRTGARDGGEAAVRIIGRLVSARPIINLRSRKSPSSVSLPLRPYLLATKFLTIPPSVLARISSERIDVTITINVDRYSNVVATSPRRKIRLGKIRAL